MATSRLIVMLFGHLAIGGGLAGKLFAYMEATMLFKRILFVLIVLALSFSVSSPAAAKGDAAILGSNSSTAIPGRYIVVFKAGLLRPM